MLPPDHGGRASSDRRYWVSAAVIKAEGTPSGMGERSRRPGNAPCAHIWLMDSDL